MLFKVCRQLYFILILQTHSETDKFVGFYKERREIKKEHENSSEKFFL